MDKFLTGCPKWPIDCTGWAVNFLYTTVQTSPLQFSLLHSIRFTLSHFIQFALFTYDGRSPLRRREIHKNYPKGSNFHSTSRAPHISMNRCPNYTKIPLIMFKPFHMSIVNLLKKREKLSKTFICIIT